MSAVTTRPVGPDDVPTVAELFGSQRATGRCWCMAFCVTRTQFALGWLAGGNRRRFEAMTASGSAPMGVLALSGAEAVGWAACGPRSRYTVEATLGRPLTDGRGGEDSEGVWFLPCLFVRAAHRGRGLTHVLVAAAVDLARREGARAIEGWPLAAAVGSSGDAFLGRQRVFEDLGFEVVERPTPQRVVVRLELRGA